MERRSLVGRRYEDHLKNNIVIELSQDELLWRMILSDPRYNPLIERRQGPRRKTEAPDRNPLNMLVPEGAFTFIRELPTKDKG